MACNEDTEKAAQSSATPSSATLASRDPELWKPAADWGGDEATEPVPDLPDPAVTLGADQPLETGIPTEGARREVQELKGEGTPKIRVGDTVRSIIRHVSPYIRLAILVGICGAIIYLFGQWQRGQLPAVLRGIGLVRRPSLKLVEAYENRVLIWEVTASRSEVLVQTSPQAGWVRVSRDDTTAANPALSPDADQVAYLSLKDSGKVVIAPLDDNKERIAISVTQLQSVAIASRLSDVAFCEWTPLAWDADGHRLAFFGCRKEKPRSVAFVAWIDGDPVEVKLIGDSEADIVGPRQLKWSGLDHIVVTVPSPAGEQIKTLPVP